MYLVLSLVPSFQYLPQCIEMNTSQISKEEPEGSKALTVYMYQVQKEVKVKVTGEQNYACMERSIPRQCVCQILKVYLKWIGSYDQFSKPKRRFLNLNADSEVKVKVTGIKILACMERSCPKVFMCQILKVYLNWYGS